MSARLGQTYFSLKVSSLWEQTISRFFPVKKTHTGQTLVSSPFVSPPHPCFPPVSPSFRLPLPFLTAFPPVLLPCFSSFQKRDHRNEAQASLLPPASIVAQPFTPLYRRPSPSSHNPHYHSPPASLSTEPTLFSSRKTAPFITTSPTPNLPYVFSLLDRLFSYNNVCLFFPVFRLSPPHRQRPRPVAQSRHEEVRAW